MASIINIGATCWDVASAEQTGLLIDARDYYRAFYHAARAAKRYVLISGWQFDSDVRLLRGEDAEDAGDDLWDHSRQCLRMVLLPGRGLQ